MMTNYFMAIPFDIFNLSLVGCGIVCGVALLLTVLFLALKCSVTYYDVEGGKEVIHKEKHSWCSHVKIHGANKKGKRLIGWSTKENGKKPLLKHKIVLFKNVKLFAIWEEAPDMVPASMIPKPVEEEPKEEADFSEGVFVKFNFIDTQSEETIATQSFKINGRVPNEDGVLGWCFNPGGDITLQNGTENYVFDVNPYPVTALLDDDKTVISNEEFSGECVVDLAYIITSTEKTVYKESHYVELNAPETFASSASFVGWSVEPNGEPIIEKGDNDAVFTIQLYSVTEDATEEAAEEVVYEEPVEEVVYEEPSEEVVYEEPVEEVVYEEPVEEVVYEEPSEEVVEETPVEEAVEEPVEEVVYEEPVEEAVEEAPVEEPAEEAPVEEPAEEAPVEEPAEVTPTIVPTYIDNEGNKIEIKYSRSFTANLIQADDTVKDFYGQLKNHIMSFKGVKTKISWKFDSYNKGRDQLFKMKLRGKTILLYCALDPEEFEKSKYHHEAIDNKLFADVPMLLKIKSGLGLRKAKEIINIVMAKYGIEPNPKATAVDYVKEYPYEDNEALLERKLVKVLEADSANIIKSSKKKAEDAESLKLKGHDFVSLFSIQAYKEHTVWCALFYLLNFW